MAADSIRLQVRGAAGAAAAGPGCRGAGAGRGRAGARRCCSGPPHSPWRPLPGLASAYERRGGHSPAGGPCACGCKGDACSREGGRASTCTGGGWPCCACRSEPGEAGKHPNWCWAPFCACWPLAEACGVCRWQSPSRKPSRWRMSRDPHPAQACMYSLPEAPAASGHERAPCSLVQALCCVHMVRIRCKCQCLDLCRRHQNVPGLSASRHYPGLTCTDMSCHPAEAQQRSAMELGTVR